MNERLCRTDRLSASFSIEALQEIVRNCKRNEECLHELIHATRDERRKVEYILRELYYAKQQQQKEQLANCRKAKRRKPVEYFVPFNDTKKSKVKTNCDRQSNKRSSISSKSPCEKNKNKTKSIEEDNQSTPSILRRSFYSDYSNTECNHRVRFSIPEKNKNHIQTDDTVYYHHRSPSTNVDDELSNLARRCEDLLTRLRSNRSLETMFNNVDYDSPRIPIYPRYKSIVDVELDHPNVISHSCQRYHNNINLSHGHDVEADRKYQYTDPYSYSNLITSRTQFPVTYNDDIKPSPMTKYQLLSKVNDRLRPGAY